MDLEKYKKSYEELQQVQKTKNLDYYAHPSRYYVKPFRLLEMSIILETRRCVPI